MIESARAEIETAAQAIRDELDLARAELTAGALEDKEHPGS